MEQYLQYENKIVKNKRQVQLMQGRLRGHYLESVKQSNRARQEAALQKKADNMIKENDLINYKIYRREIKFMLQQIYKVHQNDVQYTQDIHKLWI